jgi:membrane fusion protein (multidrug efflux system)
MTLRNMISGYRAGSSRVALALLFSAVLSACGGEGEAASTGRRPGGPTPPVEVVTVARGSMSRTTTVTGAVEPLHRVGVNAQIAGVLTEVLVEEGDRVSEGQVLARIDDREISAQVRAAEAQLRLAESTMERSEALREAQVMTVAEYERDRANLEAARAQLDQLRTRQSFATIRSPISGVVTERRLFAGDAVAPQTRLFSIADLGTLIVRLPVSELDVGSLRVGEVVELRMDALPNQTFEGRVRRVFPTADTTTRLVPVEVALLGEGARRARPGYLARVTFQLDERENALLVPVNAVFGTAGAEAVYVVEEDKALRRPVITGLRQSDRIEILSGLTEGETVIVAGHNTLRDGATIRVINPPGDTRQAAVDSVTPAAASVQKGDRP